MESIMNTEKGTCFACGTKTQTEQHHIFFGHGLRKLSDDMGLWVYLCPNCHKGTAGVHGRDGNKLNRELKRTAQILWERQHSHDEWMEKIGRSYL